MTTREKEGNPLLDLQKRMEADLKGRTQKRSENRAEELGISPVLLQYLDALENRLDKMEQKVEKLYAARD